MTAAAASEWPWPDALDALVAAPQHHTLLLENRHVRVLEAFIRPGDRVPVHTHRWPSVLHILSWSDFIGVMKAAPFSVIHDSMPAPPRHRP